MHIARAIERLRAAPAGDRATFVAMLARALTEGGHEEGERRRIEAALLCVLDDPNPLVRRSLAEAIAWSRNAPRHLVHLIARDQPRVAVPVVLASPLLRDGDLIDLAAGPVEVQIAVASRADVSCAVSAALAEVAAVEACVVLLRNPGAQVLRRSIERLVDRFGADPTLRSVLLEREDLPVELRQQLLAQVANALRALVTGRAWLPEAQAQRVISEATEAATLALAEREDPFRLRALVGSLHRAGQITPKLLVRAACTGNVMLLEAALSLLSGQAPERVAGILRRGRGAALRALLARAGLPPACFGAIEASLLSYRELTAEGWPVDTMSFGRIMVERTLTRYEAMGEDEADKLLSLLQRIASDLARAEARRDFRHMRAAA
jgi:uncharacterized protein (DUF2336 family)